MFSRQPFFERRFVSPWREMAQLQREMNRLFSDSFFVAGNRNTPTYPAMNAWTNQDGAVITVELPGVNPEDIDISVAGETLTLTGSRQPRELQAGEKYHRRERNYGQFSRTVQLPFKVEADQVEATFARGVLSISLVRAEEDKPKKITVKSA